MIWVSLPFLALFGALLPGPLLRHLRIDPAIVAGLIAVLGLVILLPYAPQVLNSAEPLIWSLPWIPSLGLDLAFRLDGLSFLMSLLILGIGVLIVLYARYYLHPNELNGRFFGPLLAFMGAMLGIALSENMLVMVIFWELTSISSFLLISFWQHRNDARHGARMALAITGMGGLALLAGVILIGEIIGSYQLSVAFEQAEVIKNHALYPVVLGLVLLGVFTKSAQFPFHFWLPHAMAAPTPVSAYLHSATMVKAGVFLLARFFPILSGTDLWFYAVTLTGMTTLLLGAFVAIFQHDLKGLLAYSTISHLGLITMLFGLDTPLAPTAALFHLINHAVFKASLFMAAGIIDHETGTRDLRKLSGLFKLMPMTATLAIVAAASMAGIPLLNGFLSKEMFFAEILESDRLFGLPWLLPLAAVLAGIFSVAYSARFVRDVFFGEAPKDLPKTPHEPPRWMRVPVEFLVVLCIAIGIFPALLVGDLILSAAAATTQLPASNYEIHIWHGFNLPLAMSAIALVGGLAIYLMRHALFSWVDTHMQVSQGRNLFDRLLSGLVGFARWLESSLATRELATHMRWLLLVALLIIGFGLIPRLPWQTLSAVSFDPVTAALLLGTVLAVFGVVRYSGKPLTAIIFLGVAGLMVTLVFAWVSAPDLALTQLLVELVAILLLLVALPHLGRPPKDARSVVGRGFDASLAVGLGAVTTLACWLLLSLDLTRISAYFLETSVPLAKGYNVVNVILVDYRGFDTFGEVTVLAIASIGILSLFDHLSRLKPPSNIQANTTHLLKTVCTTLLNLALVTSVFIFLRGHNAPGGGFIAGLTAAVGLIFVYQARSPTGDPIRRPSNMAIWLALGVVLAALPGLLAMAFGSAFLTAGHTYLDLPLIGSIHLSTVMIFDLGVFIVVVGTVMAMLPTLGRLPVPQPYRIEEDR